MRPCTGEITDHLYIVSCSEPDSRIDPSAYFNLSANSNTQVVKTTGGRTEPAISSIYAIDQTNRIGMIVVLHHTCKLD